MEEAIFVQYLRAIVDKNDPYGASRVVQQCAYVQHDNVLDTGNLVCSQVLLATSGGSGPNIGKSAPSATSEVPHW